MTVEQFLAGVEARLTELETEIRATPRPGPVLRPFESIVIDDKGEAEEIVPWLYPGRERESLRIGADRKIKDPEWALVDADWQAVCADSEPVEGEAVAA